MSTVFFDSVLEFIGKRINYEAVANYAGNSFMKDSWKLIQENHPLQRQEKSGTSGIRNLLRGIPMIKIDGDAKGALPSWANRKKEKEEDNHVQEEK